VLVEFVGFCESHQVLASELNSQRKLDLSWNVLLHRDLSERPTGLLRKWAQVCLIARKAVGVRRSEVWMVENIEKFGTELDPSSWTPEEKPKS
jgi:hypothetical protein